MAQLMPLPLNVSCFSTIQLGFIFLVPAHMASPRKRAIKQVCLCTVIHNYGNHYEKWNIFVARPHLRLQLGTVKPEIMLCETVLDLSMLLTYLAWDEMDQRIIDAAIRQWRTRLRACIKAKGGHFEHTLSQ